MAVLPVILFHAGVKSMGGGFVGVDIFFVISGYLITGVILDDLRQGRFSVLHFYERRARRILPALFLVMACCLPFAWFWMFPQELFQFSKSLVAVSTYSSNVLFLQESDYFGPSSELKPLLHTWSLAVEEQFYLIFPAFLILLWRFQRRRALAWLAVLALLSLACAHFSSWYEVPMTAEAAFYLLPTRSFELLIGAAVALHELREPPDDTRPASWGRQSGSLVGAALVLGSIFGFDRHTPFPGLAALAPTVGTALIILCAERQTLVGRLLGMRALVGVGLVSYSAYLWHQPLLAFARLRSLHEPPLAVLLSLALLSLPLAYLSWRFVERPFRSGKRVSTRTVWAAALAATVLMIGVGMVGYRAQGFPMRQSANGQPLGDLAQRVRFNYGYSQACSKQFNDSAECMTHAEPELLVWGDSYAMHLVPGILASRPDVRLAQLTKGGCAPAVAFSPFDAQSIFGKSFAKDCLAFNASVMTWLKQHPSVRHVLIATPFANFTEDEPSKLLMADGSVSTDKRRALPLFIEMLDEIARSGVKPVVFGPPPSSGHDNGQCLTKSALFGYEAAVCNFSWVASKERHQKAQLAILKEIAHKHRVVTLHQAICAGDVCGAEDGGTFIYGIGTHLSYEGSRHVGRKMDFYAQIVQGSGSN